MYELQNDQLMMLKVAYDVISMIDLMNVEAGRGYIKPVTIGKLTYEGTEEQLKSDIPKLSRACVVCARGAMLLARIHLFGGIDHLPNNSEAQELSKKYFPQGDDIEAEFEGWNRLRPQLSGLTPKQRLLAIMRNIIQNDGVFRPMQLGD